MHSRQRQPTPGASARGRFLPPHAFSWAFVLESHPDGTRLIVRERYGCPTLASKAMVQAISPIATVMTIGMLRGIRRRAESSPEAAD